MATTLGVSMSKFVEGAVIDRIERTGAALAEDDAHTLGIARFHGVPPGTA